eukprot:TRINITY_DN1167_c0_g2_i3.p1 TRINITY_DN1167_c0_g2~~TRINITY_DN1167_c0_g2_i3.p1  ORF type:complete len:190 (-),score=10.01 TRINITY_DN1167_c0_g2_i3:87-656(-)
MGWLAWNLTVGLCFIGFIVAFYVSPDGSTKLPCSIYFASQISRAKLDVSKAYVIFVAALSVIMGITFIVVGLKFLVPIWFRLNKSKQWSKPQKDLMIYTWLVMLSFAVCFVVKSILLMVASSVDTFTVPIIVFALLEQIPTGVLLWYLRPPSLTKSSLSTSRSKGSKGSSKKGSDSTTSSIKKGESSRG